MTDESHQIVESAGCSDIIIRKSRFVGSVVACSGEPEVRVQLDMLRQRHPKATHHVFAWRILDGETCRVRYRFDDDGEPGGTAGRPVLQVLESQAVVGALATVVRYFGGIKLGAGGLVRAYAEAAGKALSDAVLKPLIRKVLLRVRVSFSYLSAVEGVAARERIAVLDRGFEPEPRLLLEVPEARRAAIECALRDLTGGTASVTVERSRKRPHGEPD